MPASDRDSILANPFFLEKSGWADYFPVFYPYLLALFKKITVEIEDLLVHAANVSVSPRKPALIARIIGGHSKRLRRGDSSIMRVRI